MLFPETPDRCHLFGRLLKPIIYLKEEKYRLEGFKAWFSPSNINKKTLKRLPHIIKEAHYMLYLMKMS